MKLSHIVGVALICFTIVEAHAEQKASPSSGAKAPAAEVQKKPEKEAEEQSSTKASEEALASTSDEYGKPKGLLGDITVGPQITIFGFPSTFRFGVEGKFKNMLGFGVEYGFIPTMPFGSVTMGLNAFQGTLKWFPSSRSFYLGMAMGSQNFNISTPTTVAGTTVTITGTANTFFITPMLGWKWVAHSGLFFGMDFGWQVALSASGTTTTSNAALTAAALASGEFTSLNNTLTSLGKSSLPSFTMLQVGYYF